MKKTMLTILSILLISSFFSFNNAFASEINVGSFVDISAHESIHFDPDLNYDNPANGIR